MFGQHGGDAAVEVGCVVQILDVRAAHAEDVRDPFGSQAINYEIDHTGFADRRWARTPMV